MRDMIKNVHLVFMKSTHYFPILIKFEFSLQIFEKHSYFGLHDHPCSRRRDVPCGQTYMVKRVDAFPNFANAPKHAKYKE